MKRNILFILACILSVISYGKNALPIMKGHVVYDVDVEELSGLCMSADGTMLVSCGDQGVVKSISFDGAEAKEMVLQGLVKVNGENELRRGRKLYKGDTVQIDLEEKFELVVG